MGKRVWKCLNYSRKEIRKTSDEGLKAMLLAERASCRFESPPKEFDKFSAIVIEEMKKRGIDYKRYIG